MIIGSRKPVVANHNIPKATIVKTISICDFDLRSRSSIACAFWTSTISLPLPDGTTRTRGSLLSSGLW